MDSFSNDSTNPIETAQNLVLQVKKRIEELAMQDGLSGIATGLQNIDKITSGWQPSDLIIIAGRPSMGKSAFVLSIARNISIDFGIPLLFFSLETSSIQLLNRLISAETGLSLVKLRTGALEKHEWELLAIKTKKLEKAPMFFDDTPDISVDNLCKRARELVIEKGVKILFIDNIHLISAGNKGNGDITREQEISIVVRKLKVLAKELNIPIIVISQLSREVEFRGASKRPILSDLRGSGTLEEIADIVSFLYRPEYYKIDEWDDDEQLSTIGQAEFIIAKHRNGSLENIRLKFVENIGKFDNLEDNIESYDDLPSKFNLNDNPFQTKNLPSPNEAFGSNLNDDDDDDMPF